MCSSDLSWNYGVELNDLIGEPISFVIPELERRIKEALIQDDRVENVDNFEFQNIKGKVQCRFSVHTKYGNIKAEKVVSV